jgi:hypothetical protein
VLEGEWRPIISIADHSRPPKVDSSARALLAGEVISGLAQLLRRGFTDAIPLLDANLQEEVATDQKLMALGEASANPQGAQKKAS